jgi:ABC-type Fe3+/spermidine/putrescine transport system ATPase subunit
MPKDDLPNQLEARISSVTYLGDIEEYWLKVKNQWDVKAVINNPGTYERKSGDMVYIQFQPEDAILLSN